MLTVKLDHWPPTPDDHKTLNDSGYTVQHELPATKQLIVDRTIKTLVGETPAQVAAHAQVVKGLPGVTEADPDFVVKTCVNDARSLTRAPSLPPIMAGDGAGVVVGIIDTGLDIDHPGFAGQVVRVLSQADFTGEGNGDGVGHGTHVAGIIGMSLVDGYSGFAPKCAYRIYKVLGKNGSGTATAIVRAINQAIVDRVNIINMSLGGSTPGDRDQLTDAVDAAVAAGIAVCVAAGNEGMEDPFDNTPAKSLRAITVGATSKAPEEIADFSSGGVTLGKIQKPDLSAPGVDIVSARAKGTTMGTPKGERLIAASGTSMATPAVTGMVACMLSRQKMTPIEVKARLMASAEPVGDPGPHLQGTGRCNVFAAFTSPRPPDSAGESRRVDAPVPATPSPLVSAALESLLDLLKSARTHVQTTYRSGGKVPGLATLAEAAEQFAATARGSA